MKRQTDVAELIVGAFLALLLLTGAFLVVRAILDHTVEVHYEQVP